MFTVSLDINLVILQGIMTQALSLSKSFWDFCCNLFWINSREMSQILLDLSDGFWAVHLLEPGSILQSTVTVLVVNWPFQNIWRFGNMLTLEFNFYLQIFVACIHSVSYYEGPILSV